LDISPIAVMAWLRALMTATRWPAFLAQLRDQRMVAVIGDAPWLGMGFGTFPEVLRNEPAGDRRPSAT
jgi:hypothetical protein